MRLVIALAVAMLSGWYAANYAATHPSYSGDIDHLWHSGQLIIDGRNPYEVIGVQGLKDPVMPGWRWRLYYPLPAVVAVVPLTGFPRVTARIVFVAVTGFLFAFAITRYRWEPLAACLSGAYLSAIHLAQWSPLLVATAIYPWLGFAIACKPNIGLVALAAMDRWASVLKGLTVALGITGVAFLIAPSWFTQWREIVASNEHYVPLVMRPWGWLPLLALYRWRQSEARVLAALVVIPMTPGVREALFIWLAPLSWWQSLMLAASSHFVTPLVNRFDPGTQFPEFIAATAQAVLWLVYVPATVFVLARVHIPMKYARARPLDVDSTVA